MIGYKIDDVVMALVNGPGNNIQSILCTDNVGERAPIHLRLPCVDLYDAKGCNVSGTMRILFLG